MSSNEPNDFFVQNEGFLLDFKKYSNFTVNKDITNKKDLENFKNNYLKILLKNNNQKIIPKNKNLNNIQNNIKLEYLTSNYINEIEKNNNINNFNMNITVKELIDRFIKLKIYEDIYDFFLSHFVQKIITIDSFLNNLTFNSSGNNKNNKKTIIQKQIIDFFKEFTPDELYTFNKAITGSTYKLSKKYTIKLLFNFQSNSMVNFHTCFCSLDIYYSELLENVYLNSKSDFINLLATSESFSNIW